MFGFGRRRHDRSPDQTTAQTTDRTTDRTPDRIEVSEAVARTAAGSETILLDVREAEEWASGHAPDAMWMPLSAVDPADPIPAELDGRCVVVICRSGHRSQQAAAFLRERGTDAVDVVGGMVAWVRAGHPVVDDQGNPGSII